MALVTTQVIELCIGGGLKGDEIGGIRMEVSTNISNMISVTPTASVV
jgi:hypothetical protein